MIDIDDLFDDEEDEFNFNTHDYWDVIEDIERKRREDTEDEYEY